MLSSWKWERLIFIPFFLPFNFVHAQSMKIIILLCMYGENNIIMLIVIIHEKRARRRTNGKNASADESNRKYSNLWTCSFGTLQCAMRNDKFTFAAEFPCILKE